MGMGSPRCPLTQPYEVAREGSWKLLRQEKELCTSILHSGLHINTLVLTFNFGIAFFFPDVILLDWSTDDLTQCKKTLVFNGFLLL